MKTTIDIPDRVLDEAMRYTRAKTKRDAVVRALEKFNRLQRLRELNEKLKGKFVDFMSQRDLKVMREDAPRQGPDLSRRRPVGERLRRASRARTGMQKSSLRRRARRGSRMN